MIVLSHKTKQYLLAALKVFILLAAAWYIYFKLTNTNGFSINDLYETIKVNKVFSISNVTVFFAFAFANWFFESLKWKLLVNSFYKITFYTAFKQTVASLLVSLLTPNRIGEYGAKALYFKAENRKRILLLNFIGNTTQFIVTIIFGIIGLIYLLINFEVPISNLNLVLLFLVVLLFGFLAYLFRERELLVKGLSIQKMMQFVKKLPRGIVLKTGLLSLIRYAIFSHLFYFILFYFNVETDYITIMMLLFALYILVSIAPTIFIFDVVVRGGIAVWLFSLVGVDEGIILSAVMLMWLLNFVLPSIIGSIYVATFKPVKK